MKCTLPADQQRQYKTTTYKITKMKKKSARLTTARLPLKSVRIRSSLQAEIYHIPENYTARGYNFIENVTYGSSPERQYRNF